jgi:mycothiol synthase
VTNEPVRLRPAALADAEAVTALVNARELLDRGITEATATMVRAQWTTPDIEIAADGLVGEVDGQIVGAALATREREYVYVATDHEGHGLGTRLRDWVMARSVARGAIHHLQIVGSRNTAAAALLQAAGYERVRAFQRMRLALPRPPISPEPGVRGDVRIRRIDAERDAPELHQLDAAAFAANADYHPETFEQFRDEHLRAADSDPRVMLAAIDGDRLVGSLLGARRRRGEVGYVSVLAVDPEARRQGIATLLLRSAFDAWQAAGIHRAELTVASDNPGARQLYERLGMEIAFELHCYERPFTRD